MTPQEQAKAYALQKAGLRWDRLEKWSDADRRAYLAALGEFRQLNPQMFSPAELAAAQNYAMAGAQGDIEFSYLDATVDAVGERVEELGGKVAGVGEGIFSSLSLMRWLLPLATIAAVVILLRALAKKTKAA
jgi:hypothetical protein